jgi:hypothetical protein
MLRAVLSQVLSNQERDVDNSASDSADAPTGAPRVLNVGGNNKDIPIPGYFDGWEHLLLDIDPKGGPDIVCDARQLTSLAPAQFDAIYCSHNLEHYYKHDGLKVLQGFIHILKADGFADIRVPDMETVIKTVAERDMDIEDVLYVAPSGPITVCDVIYGWGLQIERSGVDFYAHKTGFTARSLQAVLLRSGFANAYVYVAREAFELRALAFRGQPTYGQRESLGMDD